MDRIMSNSRSCGVIVWITGLSAAGKTSVANRLCVELVGRGFDADVLDGDVMRQHISRGLDFTREGREENTRRLGFVAGLLARHGVIAIVAAISPYRAVRDELRAASGAKFFEVYMSTPIEVCEQRDPKGLYRRARTGELRQFTGIDDPYEPPFSPEITCSTESETVEGTVDTILRALLPRLVANQ
jgi:adenylyl-sulfate kinase